VIRDKDSSLGETRTLFKADLPTRADIEDRVVAVLSGRAAEEMIFRDASSNAGGDVKSDLATATRFVARLHASLGLSDSLVFLADPTEVTDLLRADRALRRKVDRHLVELHHRAVELIMRKGKLSSPWPIA
jgi:cell division protease FtsH